GVCARRRVPMALTIEGRASRALLATLAIAAAALVTFHVTRPDAAETGLQIDRIKLPPGFAIELAARVPNARGMTWGDKGTLFVGSNEGRVFAVTFAPNDPKGAPTVRVVASGLSEPAGVAFRNGALYVSAISRILRFDDIEAHLTSPPAPVVVT